MPWGRGSARLLHRPRPRARGLISFFSFSFPQLGRVDLDANFRCCCQPFPPICSPQPSTYAIAPLALHSCGRVLLQDHPTQPHRVWWCRVGPGWGAVAVDISCPPPVHPNEIEIETETALRRCPSIPCCIALTPASSGSRSGPRSPAAVTAVRAPGLPNLDDISSPR